MPTHQWFSKLTILSMLVILTCCSSSEGKMASHTHEASHTFRIALLLPRPIESDSWSRAGYEAVALIEQELSAHVAYTANIAESEMETIFRYYVAEEFDFIIGMGEQFIPAAKVVADEFPNTQFAVVARYEGNNKNLGALSFRDSEVGYLAGAVAGLKTTTNHVAFVGGLAYPHIREQAAAFRQGARVINPSVQVSTAWVGNWHDSERARELARTSINTGADILVVNAGQSDMAVFQEAADAGTAVIGWVGDEYEHAPGVVLTSIVQHIPVLLLEGCTLAQQGHWQGKLYLFGLQEKVQDLAPFRGSLQPEDEQLINTIKREIIEGKRDVTTH